MTFLEELPNDYGPKGKGFTPPSYKAEKALAWAKQNALPIIGLAVAVMI